jgi:hypothetical protein
MYAKLMAAVLLTAPMSFGALAAGVADLDQQALPTDDGLTGIGSGPSGPIGGTPLGTWIHAQTFTVGLTGTLAQIDLPLSRSQFTATNFIVGIWPTLQGAPDTSVDPLFAASFSPTSIAYPVPQPYTSFDLSGANIAVTAGDVLAIVLTRPAETVAMSDQVYWLLAEPYVGGAAFKQFTGFPWLPELDEQTGAADFAFRSYVAVVPIPSAVGLLGSALAVLAWTRRRATWSGIRA